MKPFKVWGHWTRGNSVDRDAEENAWYLWVDPEFWVDMVGVYQYFSTAYRPIFFEGIDISS